MFFCRSEVICLCNSQNSSSVDVSEPECDDVDWLSSSEDSQEAESSSGGCPAPVHL